jgi:hypothetical protein
MTSADAADPRALVPLVGVAVLIVVGIGWRSWLQRRRYGSWGISVFRSREPRQLLRDGFLLLLPVLLVGQALVLALRPHEIAASMLVRPWDVAGVAALFGGIALMVRAQLGSDLLPSRALEGPRPRRRCRRGAPMIDARRAREPA